MFDKGLSLKKWGRKQPAEYPGATSPHTERPETIKSLLNSSGRVSLPILAWLAQTYARSEFVQFMRRPVLSGASIQLGSLNSHRSANRNAVNQTFVFQTDSNEESASFSEALAQAVYPLVKHRDFHRAPNIFTIGRIASNDLIIPDIAISKRHAILEVDRDRYFIRDCQSTNGVMINGCRIAEKAHQIQDEDTVSLARYEFVFLSPAALYARLTGQG